jgi:orotate phosphoribosyltransferase
VIQESIRKDFHPEGLTESQERLADLLFETKIQAKVRRRRQLPDETFEFYEIIRDTSPVGFPQDPGEFVLKLHEQKPEAPLSPIYVNLRNLPEEVLDQIGKVLAEMGDGEIPDFCAGIPIAGVPIAQVYSKFSGIELVDIFEKEQTDSSRRIVPGLATQERGKRARLIDDLVTKADTKLEAIRATEDLGYEVADIFVLVDREQSGVEQLAKAGYKLYAAFKLSQLLRYYLITGRIDQAQFDQVTSYLAAS